MSGGIDRYVGWRRSLAVRCGARPPHLKWSDWPLVQGLLVVNTLLIVCANLTADLSYAVADPRIKYA